MRRREFVAGVGGVTALVCLPIGARAQPAAKTWRVGFLAYVTDNGPAEVRQRLQELGYVEGKNSIFQIHSAEGRAERLPELAAALVKSSPDAIIAGFGTVTAQAVKAATSTIPVVFASVGDPIETGIVQSLSRPGANITGLHSQAAEIAGKRLQILQELAPEMRALAVVMNPGPFTTVALQDLKVAAQARGVRIEACEGQTVEQLSVSVAAAVAAGASALTILETPLLLGLRQGIVDLVAKHRLPAIYSTRDFVAAGGLLSYGADRRQLYRRAAELAGKILQGAKPADIPVEQPTKFEFVINLAAARALGIQIPNTLLATADEVIE